MGIIQERAAPDSTVYRDNYGSIQCPGYVVVQVRINHSMKFAEGQNHINGIENFGSQAKRHMRKFNGIPREHSSLFFMECGWRFNNPGFTVQLAQLHRWVK